MGSARSDQDYKRPVSRPLRLQNSKVQTLEVGGQPIGVPESQFMAQNGKQSWAMLNKYWNNNKYGWNKAGQFFFTAKSYGLAIFANIKKRFHVVRSIKKSNVKIKATHKFDKSFDTLTPSKMELIFKRAANKYLRGK